MIESIMIRTRIAPSPTGFAHVGTAYTALFNFAFAKKNKGEFILRLEDTDVDRHVKGAEEAIFENLSWLGLTWNEGPDIGGSYGPYKQSQKLSLYKERAEDLIKRGLAYGDDGAVRFKNPQRQVSWNDLVRNKVSFPADQITDFVILKSDGYPTYNFAVVNDDIDMEITHVIRGEEHISNTPRQLVLYEAFGKTPPLYAHLPTIRNQQHQKLSKRRDPVDLRLYREEGYLPEALINFLCLLGWSHPEGKEIFGLKEFVDKFSLERVRSAGPIFDAKKLDWLNGHYIREKSDKELALLINEHSSIPAKSEEIEKIVPLVKERIKKLSEADDLISFFWEEPNLGSGLFDDPKSLRYIVSAIKVLSSVPLWNLKNINEVLGREIEKNDFKVGKFYMALRLSITGKRETPPINESMEILGKEKVLHRLRAVEKLLIEIEPPEIS